MNILKKLFFAGLFQYSLLTTIKIDQLYAMEIDLQEQQESDKPNLLARLPIELTSLIIYFFVQTDSTIQAINNFKRFSLLSKELKKFTLKPYNIKLTDEEFTEQHVEFFVDCGYNGFFIARLLNVNISNLENEYRIKNLRKELDRYNLDYKNLAEWSDQKNLSNKLPEELNNQLRIYAIAEEKCGIHNTRKNKVKTSQKNECNIIPILSLILAGANVNTRDIFGKPIICLVARNTINKKRDRSYLIELLINLGADPNAQELDYRATALLWSVHLLNIIINLIKV